MAAWQSTSARGLLACVLAGSGLALGALDADVLVACAAVAAAACALACAGREAVKPRSTALALLVVWAVLAAHTALQLVPGPMALVGALSPHAMHVWSTALSPPIAEARATLSVDPGAGRVELLRGLLYGAVLLATLRVARGKGGATFLERAVVACAIVMALAAIVHVALDAKLVFGLYRPKTYVSLVAPLLNANQLAGYLNVGLLVAFASMIGAAPMAPRPLLAVAVVGLVGAEIWLASRGAVAAMSLGILLAVGLTLATRRVRSSRAVGLAALTVVLGAAAAMFVIGQTDPSMRGLTDTDVSKLSLQWHALRSMARAYPLVGAGRGAFEAAFQEFYRGRGGDLWASPENVVVTWVSEWGLVVAPLALLALAWALRPSMLLRQARPAIGPWVALAALALQNLVDFSSETPGVMVALVVCAGLVVGGELREPERTFRLPERIVATVAVVATAGGVAFAWPVRGHQLVDERRALKAESSDASLTNEVFHEHLREAILRHPAEPYLPYLGAARSLLFTPSENLVVWIDRTLERSPVYPQAHLLLARWLRPRNRSQALLEYRLAAEQNGSEVAAEALALVQSYDDVLELVPDGAARADVVETLARTLAPRLPATVARLDADALASRSPAPGPRLRAAQAVLRDLEDGEGAPWCAADRAACASRALELAREAAAHFDECEPHRVAAVVRMELGEQEQALAELQNASERVSDRARCLRVLAEMSIAAGQAGRAGDAITKLADAACSNEQECVENLVAAAELEDRRGNHTQALLVYKRAAAAYPARDDLLERAASQARSRGLHAFAADAYGKLAVRHPDNAAYGRAAREESEAIGH